MTDPITQDASENMSPAAIVEAPQDLPAARSVVPDEICDVEAKWWGYQLILTQRAVDTLVECLDYIDAKLTKIIPNKEIRAAIRLILDIKKFRLTRVSKKTGSQGCRLVSPWICPVALVVVRKKADADLSLYTSVWDSSSHTWGEESAFTDIESATGPALAQFRDRLYCVYRGKDDDQSLYWMVYTSADGWSDGTAEDYYPEDRRPKKFPNHQTAQPPALVVFKDTLYCFHRGCKKDEALWYCTLTPDGRSWTSDVKLDYNGVASINGISATVFKERLYLVFQANQTHDQIAYISTGDGHTWSPFTTLDSGNNGSHLTCDTPAVAAYKDKLHVVHRGKGDELLWHCVGTGDSSGNITWSKDDYLGDHKAEQGPALAVFENKLVMVHRSSGKDGALWGCYYDGASWSKDTKFANDQVTGDNPALVSYMDPNVDSESYVDPSYGGQKLIVAYRGK